MNPVRSSAKFVVYIEKCNAKTPAAFDGDLILKSNNF